MMATQIRIVSVASGVEVARAVLAADGTVTYTGATGVVEPLVRRKIAAGASEADAVAELARDGWSNGYLMVALDPEQPPAE